MLRLSFAFIATVMLTACADPIDTISKRPAVLPKAGVVQPVLPAPATRSADAFAKAFLDGIQAESIAERREFCGFFYRDAAGQMQGTTPRRGTFASCNMPVPNRRDNIIASYHTHGAYGPQYDNEVPSATDLLSDFELGLNGYISTPGGRVWRVNHRTRDAIQVCGLGCVTRDPGFIPRDEGGVQQRYTVGTLNQRNGS